MKRQASRLCSRNVPKTQSIEDMLQELDAKVAQVEAKLAQLRQVNLRLEERIRELEQNRADAVKRINVVLDRVGRLR